MKKYACLLFAMIYLSGCTTMPVSGVKFGLETKSGVNAEIGDNSHVPTIRYTKSFGGKSEKTEIEQQYQMRLNGESSAGEWGLIVAAVALAVALKKKAEPAPASATRPCIISCVPNGGCICI